MTDPEQVRSVGPKRSDLLDILINNAGIGLFDDLTDRAALEQHVAVNLYGPYGMTQAFLPALMRSQGAVVNVLSIAALAALPVIPAYSASKAAALLLNTILPCPFGRTGGKRPRRPARAR